MIKSLNRNYKLKASFTIESTYIVPLILILLLAVVWYGFYQHDLLVMSSWEAYVIEEARMAEEYGKLPYDNKIDIEGLKSEADRWDVEDALKEQNWNINDRLIAGYSDGKSIAVDKNETELKCSYISIPFRYLSDEEIFKETKFKRSVIYKNPARNTRITTTIYRIVRKGGCYD